MSYTEAQNRAKVRAVLADETRFRRAVPGERIAVALVLDRYDLLQRAWGTIAPPSRVSSLAGHPDRLSAKHAFANPMPSYPDPGTVQLSSRFSDRPISTVFTPPLTRAEPRAARWGSRPASDAGVGAGGERYIRSSGNPTETPEARCMGS